MVKYLHEGKKGKRGFVMRKRRKKEKLKVIWEYDKSMPKEERDRRVEQVFEMLLLDKNA